MISSCPEKKDRSGKVSDDYADAVAALQSRRMAGFYSQLERVVEQKMQARSSPQQLLAMLRNPQNGVKSDELAWRGLEQFLEDRKGVPVTKQEMQDFLKQNEVRVEEVTRGATPIRRRSAPPTRLWPRRNAKLPSSRPSRRPLRRATTSPRLAARPAAAVMPTRPARCTKRRKALDGLLRWRLAPTFGDIRSGRSDRFIRELQADAKSIRGSPMCAETISWDRASLLVELSKLRQGNPTPRWRGVPWTLAPNSTSTPCPAARTTGNC